MRIVYNSLHNLDLSLTDPIRKQISADFGSFIKNYIEETLSGKTTKEYTVIDRNRTVVRSIVEVFKNPVGEKCAEHTDTVARKLLNSEQNVQDQIRGMTQIQRGSILQALIEDGRTYRFIIAKVEHSEWYDDDTFIKKYGIPGDNLKVWKSAVFDLDPADGHIVTIKCFVNTNARYWTDTFLEIQEAHNDTENTRMVIRTCGKVLSQIKKISPMDYYNLMNTINHEMQSDQLIDYNEMVSRLFDSYEPHNEEINKDNLKRKLLDAAKDGSFDTHFHADPKEAKKRKKITIPVSDMIDVSVKDPLENWKSTFRIFTEPSGEKYLMIRCDDEETLRSFDEYEKR